MIANILLAGTVIGLVACTVYLGLVIVSAFQFRSATRETEAAAQGGVPLPAVTVLKPLHGLEPFLESSLESVFRQDYPEFELIFGARSNDDPALETVRALARKYPGVKTKIVLSGDPRYPNAKVFLLEQMAAEASHGIFVIADSDVRVARDYLARVVEPLSDPKVGLVTCLYRGVPSGGIWSRLEALGMSVEMSSGVLVANLLEGMKFALGPTMVTRKGLVDRLGGFGVLGEYCADDFVLGNLAANTGNKVVLSHHVIEHIVLNRSARESFLHQIRWMKSSRFSRRLGHIGTGLTFALPFGLLGLVVGWMRGNWELGLGLLALAIANRLAMAVVVGWGVVHDRLSLTCSWLFPLRDLLGFAFWCASFVGNTIMWRGERYCLMEGGRMVRQKGSRRTSPAAQDAAT